MAAVALTVATLTACTSHDASAHDGPARNPASSVPSTPASDPARPATTSGPSGSTTSAAAPSSPQQTADVSAHRPTLPRGGRHVLGHYRVVAYYGAAGTGQLGVLGAAPPATQAKRIIHRAAGYRGFGLQVQPAMELLATVAQGSPGPDGDYSAPVPHSVIRRYLRVAHRYKMLLILDLQPGRASFLSQVKSLGGLLRDPSVEVALDSEWKVGPHGDPGDGGIGSCRARGINAAIRYVSKVVRRNDLPDKLVVLHEFTPSMLPDRRKITPSPGTEVVFHADGFGSPEVKRHVYHQLHFPGRPFGTGFKLFLHQDSRLMTPKQVMRLHRRPDVITYE